MSKFFLDKDPTLKTYLMQVGLDALGYDPQGLDNWFGDKSQDAYDQFFHDKMKELNMRYIRGLASSFADKADVDAFRRCKAKGNSDQECFKVGDNGIGYTGLDTTNENIPYVAVQPDYMIERWGSALSAAGKKVIVNINNQSHECVVGDRMPWVKNTKNGAVIDLAPGAQKLFGLKPPFMVTASWRWA